jgi:hypothetical protein
MIILHPLGNRITQSRIDRGDPKKLTREERELLALFLVAKLVELNQQGEYVNSFVSTYNLLLALKLYGEAVTGISGGKLSALMSDAPETLVA